MKMKCLNNFTNINKANNCLSSQIIEHKKNRHYSVDGNPGLGLGQLLQLSPLIQKKVQSKAAHFISGDPVTMVASLECSRTLNYHFLKKGESNRLMFKVQGGWELYQPPNILNSKTVTALPPKGETNSFLARTVHEQNQLDDSIVGATSIDACRACLLCD